MGSAGVKKLGVSEHVAQPLVAQGLADASQLVGVVADAAIEAVAELVELQA